MVTATRPSQSYVPSAALPLAAFRALVRRWFVRWYLLAVSAFPLTLTGMIPPNVALALISPLLLHCTVMLMAMVRRHHR